MIRFPTRPSMPSCSRPSRMASWASRSAIEQRAEKRCPRRGGDCRGGAAPDDDWGWRLVRSSLPPQARSRSLVENLRNWCWPRCAATAGSVCAKMPEGSLHVPFFANPASRRKNAFGGLDCPQSGGILKAGPYTRRPKGRRVSSLQGGERRCLVMGVGS